MGFSLIVRCFSINPALLSVIILSHLLLHSDNKKLIFVFNNKVQFDVHLTSCKNSLTNCHLSVIDLPDKSKCGWCVYYNNKWWQSMKNCNKSFDEQSRALCVCVCVSLINCNINSFRKSFIPIQTFLYLDTIYMNE